jgi:hypothetical protein
MNQLTIEELSILALYRSETRLDTLRNMYQAPIQEMDDDVQTIFLSARKKLKTMSEEDYQKLDFRDTLLIEEDVANG